MLRRANLMKCSQVLDLQLLLALNSHITLDRLLQEISPSQVEKMTHLAHAVTHFYLGLSSADEFSNLGVDGLTGLVDLISRVRALLSVFYKLKCFSFCS